MEGERLTAGQIRDININGIRKLNMLNAKAAPDPTQKVQGTQESKIMENETVKITKGGQTVDASFTDSIIASYANLTYSPLVLALFILAVAVAVADIFNN